MTNQLTEDEQFHYSLIRRTRKAKPPSGKHKYDYVGVLLKVIDLRDATIALHERTIADLLKPLTESHLAQTEPEPDSKLIAAREYFERRPEPEPQLQEATQLPRGPDVRDSEELVRLTGEVIQEAKKSFLLVVNRRERWCTKSYMYIEGDVTDSRGRRYITFTFPIEMARQRKFII